MNEELEDLFPESSSAVEPTPAVTQEPVSSVEVIVPEVVDEADVKTAPEDHSPLGPSRYTMWAECPCFEGREGAQGDDARRGSAAHMILSRLLNGLSAERPDDMPLEDYEAACWGYDAIRRISNGAHVVSEGKVAFNPPEDDDDGYLNVFKNVYGTVDAWWVDPSTGSLNIADFKTFDRGEKDHTPQLSGYAILLCSNHPEFCSLPIRLHVIGGGLHKVVTYETDLMTAIKLVKEILDRHLDPKAEPCPCDSCKYCGRVNQCRGIDTAVAVFDNKVLWSQLDDVEKYDKVQKMEKVIKNWKEQLEERIDKGKGEIVSERLGVKLVRKFKSASAVCMNNADLGLELEKHGIAPDVFLNTVMSVSKASVQKALIAANPSWKKGDCEKIIDMHWTVPVGAVGSKYYVKVAV